MIKKIFILSLFILTISIISPDIVFAQDNIQPDYPTLFDSQGTEGVQAPNIDDPGLQDITLLALSIARYLVGISGGVIMAMLCYGGFQYIAGYMQGDEDANNSAKTTIFNAIIGLILILSSYMIVTMFQSALTSTSFG